MSTLPSPDLDGLLSAEGWPYASALPVEPGDLGRFHALFGRDALICSLQVLPVRPDVARATLRALAALQGRARDDQIAEQPGKIGHEFRRSVPDSFVRRGYAPPLHDGAFRYYATADATSWFLVVLAALGDRGLAIELAAAWRAAARWLERSLDEGDGFVRYGTGVPRGSLSQHGWRDTTDPADPANAGGGILHPDGIAPVAPIADADCQAAAFAALRAVARLSGESAWSGRAARLAEDVQAAFGPDVMALDARNTPVPGAGSQLGWLLWSGVLGTGEAREAAADRLLASDVSTPFGLRTLSSAHRRFEPHAYHRGAVWPFDSWLGWGGLRAAGRVQGAERVRHGVLAALDHLGRAPEFYAVTPNGALEASPGANRVQAWTVGARWALEHEWDGRLRDGSGSARSPGG